MDAETVRSLLKNIVIVRQQQHSRLVKLAASGAASQEEMDEAYIKLLNAQIDLARESPP